jgi:hypothetical protein
MLKGLLLQPVSKRTCFSSPSSGLEMLTILNRYDLKSTISAFDHDDSFIYCLGPGCPSGQVHFEQDAQPIVTCNFCQFRTCFTHKVPWHDPLTCSQYDEQKKDRKEQEEASEKLIAETTKPCPSIECGWKIEKNEGCDHMTCVCSESMFFESSLCQS